jgi:hypothetical protein
VHFVPSPAAGWFAARSIPLGLQGTHEGAHELAVHLRRKRIHIDVLAGKKLASVLYAVYSGWLNLNVLEPGRRKFGAIFIFFESTRNAANPEKDTTANLRRHLTASHNIGHGKASAWF